MCTGVTTDKFGAGALARAAAVRVSAETRDRVCTGPGNDRRGTCTRFEQGSTGADTRLSDVDVIWFGFGGGAEMP